MKKIVIAVALIAALAGVAFAESGGGDYKPQGEKQAACESSGGE
jgi:hypothetical protein